MNQKIINEGMRYAGRQSFLKVFRNDFLLEVRETCLRLTKNSIGHECDLRKFHRLLRAWFFNALYQFPAWN